MFTNMYDLAKKYYEHHGNLLIPQRFITLNGYEYDENGYALGRWLINQRQFYKNNKLSNERIQALENIDMVWVVNKKQIKWNDAYTLAQKYHEHYGSLKLSYDFKTLNGYEYDENGYNLYNWVVNQRQLNNEGKLSKDKIAKLNNIDMNWNSYIKQVETWNKMYDLAKKYYQYHGNLSIERKFKTKDGFNYCEDGLKLGLWVHNQIDKYKNHILPSTKVKLLEELKIDWNVISKKEYWDIMYNLAKENYKHFGKLVVPPNFKTLNGYEYNKNGYNLSEWVNYQKINYKWNRLSNKRRKLIEEILDISNLRNYKTSHNDKWYVMYTLALNYYNYHGNLDVKEGFKTINGYEYDENGLDLYRWLYVTQVREYRNKQMTDEKKELLENIHIIWKNKKSDKEWNKYYLIAKSYYEYYGNLSVKCAFKTINGYEYDENGFALGNWISYLKQQYKIGRLSEDRIKLMNDIGMIWDIRKNRNQIKKICAKYQFKYKDYIEVLSKIPYEEMIAKMVYLRTKGIPVKSNDEMHEIFSMSSLNMKAKYGIDLQELINTYGVQSDKEKSDNNVYSKILK